VTGAVNANTDRIRQLQTDTAKLTVPGMPALRASIALERPRNFRLRAQFAGLGQVLDLGSNPDVFWALVDAPELITNVPRAVYYARHDQYRPSQMQAVLPVPPQWLIDSFGLPRFEPNQVHEGPWQRSAGQLEIRSRIPTPDGEYARVAIVHDTYGWVLEQHMYDPQGRWVVSALTSDHRHDLTAGASLPHHIEIRLPPPQRSFQIEIASYSINQLYGETAQLFAMPQDSGYPLVDLAAPFASPTATPIRPPTVPAYPAASPGLPYPPLSYRPRYRGYSTSRL
jgi:hypothetical protein